MPDKSPPTERHEERKTGNCREEHDREVGNRLDDVPSRALAAGIDIRDKKILYLINNNPVPLRS